MPPVQLITFTYQSTADLLLRFDVDCCAIAWEPQPGRVVVTKRAQHAIKTKVNVASSAFETSGYTIRLEKYAQRGFGIFIPGLDLSLVRPDVFNGHYLFFEDIEMLFSVKEVEKGPVEVWGGRMKASFIQRGTIVKGTERLIVMSRGRFQKTTLDKSQLMNAGVGGKYWILKGLRPEDSDSGTDSGEEEDDGLYRKTPLRVVESIMRERLHKDLCAEGLGVEDGGAVPFGCWRKLNLAPILRAACSTDRRSSKLAFVFDFAKPGTSFADLKFLHDAYREPLCLRGLADDAAFEAAYGIPRKLTFSSGQQRQISEIDWFSAIYFGASS